MYRTNSRSPQRLNTGSRYHGRDALVLLAAEVVGELVVERGGQLGRVGDELVVDRDGVGDEARTAGSAGVEAEQADEVGAVAVEREGDAADLVASAAGVLGCPALVGHVAEQVALVVLRPGPARGACRRPSRWPRHGRGP